MGSLLMDINNAFFASAAVLAVAGCSTTTANSEPVSNSDLNACLVQVMDFMEGALDYTGVNARVSGGYSTFITQSTHTRLDDGTWDYSSFGGDMEEPSTSFVRLVGNKILTRSEGEEEERARTFQFCEGPNEVGRITTRSTYELPPIPNDPQTLYVSVLALYGEGGGYFSETITNAAGEKVAYRSGVSVPTE